MKIKKQKNDAAALFQEVECVLLIVFLLCRIWLFIAQWNVAKGFDVGAHTKMIHILTWSQISVDMQTVFYGYHPPLAFLLARIPFLFGVPAVASIQIVSALASLFVFLFLRQTLKALGVLYQARSIAFLYVTSSLPLQIFLSHSVNMDVILLSFAAAILYFSVQLFVPHQRRNNTRVESFAWAAAITLSIVAAFMTKFTAVLLLVLPAMVVVVFNPVRTWLPRLGIACLTAAVAILIVLPYYYERYYVPTGSFFPLNTDTFDHTGQARARVARNKDPVSFITNLFLSTEVHAAGYELRDKETPRLSDTWKDLWVQDAWLGQQTAAQKKLGTFYLYIASFVLVAGVLVFLWRAERHLQLYEKFGLLVGGYALFQILFIICYSYRIPWAGALPTKAIYIAPVLWGVGYFLTYPLKIVEPFCAGRRRIWIGHVALAALIFFMVVNHFLPLY